MVYQAFECKHDVGFGDFRTPYAGFDAKRKLKNGDVLSTNIFVTDNVERQEEPLIIQVENDDFSYYKK